MENDETVTEQPEEGSVLPDKFKSGEQLAQAYAHLEAEFTRKCQSLSELSAKNERLEMELDAFKSREEKPAAVQDGNEKPWKQTVEGFLNKYPKAAAFSAELAKLLQQQPEIRTFQGLENLYLELLSQRYKPAEQLLEDENFLSEHVLGNQKIKDQIITRYLQELTEKEHPKLMQKEGGYMPMAVRRSAKTLEEAGAYTLETMK